MNSDHTNPASSAPKAPKKEVAAAAPATNSPEPIIIDMGKKNRKQVRKLRKGKPGRLLDRVNDSFEHLRENGAVGPDAQPIVIIIKESRRRRGKRFAKVWGLG